MVVGDNDKKIFGKLGKGNIPIEEHEKYYNRLFDLVIDDKLKQSDNIDSFLNRYHGSKKKAENKKYRTIILLIGLGFYYLLFGSFWDSLDGWRLDDIDFYNSFVMGIIDLNVLYNQHLFFLGLPEILFYFIKYFILFCVANGHCID